MKIKDLWRIIFLLLYRGIGTYVENGIIHSAAAGNVALLSKLIMVHPQRKLYKPEVGDVVIGRVISIEKKSWKVDINYSRDANLSLSSINLPQGEQVNYRLKYYYILKISISQLSLKHLIKYLY